MDLGEIVTSSTSGGMATGSPWGAVGAGVLNYLGSQSTNEANQDIAASNNAWSAEQYAKRYQTQVKDIQAAGLNPMLAYSQSPGTAPSAQQVQFQNPMSAAVQGYTDVLGTRAKATSDVASANRAYTEADKTEVETKRLKELLNNDEPKKFVEALVASANRDKAAGLNFEQQTKHLSQLVVNLKTQNALSQADLDAITATGAIGRIARELKPISDIGSDWFGLKGMFDKNKILSRPREKGSNTTHYDREGNVSGGSSTNAFER